MSIQLRVFLMVVSILFLIFVVHTVREKKLLLRDSLIWLLMAVLMLLLAIFPGIAMFFSSLIGIETPANFVFFAAMIMLLVLTFRQTAALSKATIQIERLTQELALAELERTTQEGACKHD